MGGVRKNGGFCFRKKIDELENTREIEIQ